MIPHDILTLYSAKMIEYAVAVFFLILFVPFWSYVMGPTIPQVQHQTADDTLHSGLRPRAYPQEQSQTQSA